MKLTGKQILMALLIIFTAVLHLAAAFDKVLYPTHADPLFILNGLGFLGLLGAYFLPIKFFQDRHKLTWWALFIYTILTIAAWIFIWVIQYVIIRGEPFFAHDSIYGVPAKIAEVTLLFLLWAEKP
ncbi:MAG: hypothetical protein HY864_03255 [Chloroflexi bacterium]|nr:hypothetical protein [Chloroflexota bacterium]